MSNLNDLLDFFSPPYLHGHKQTHSGVLNEKSSLLVQAMENLFPGWRSLESIILLKKVIPCG